MTVQNESRDNPSNLCTVKLEKLIYGGESLGRLPDPQTDTGGRAVFVPFGLPDETVQVRIVEERRGHARAELVDVLEPSPERITPKCKHYGKCGGCNYQHMPYAFQLKAKTDILHDQMVRIGKIENPPIKPIVPSPLEWNYRNHVQFHLTPEGNLGFQAFNSNKAISISECHLPEVSLNSLWPGLKFDSGLGLKRVALRLGSDQEMMLILESDDPQPPELEIEADISVVHLCDDDAIVMAGDEYLTIEVVGRPYRVSSGSFFQVNTAMAGKMVEHLLTILPTSSATTLLDVYCGAGLFSAFLAPRVGRLIGIESEPSACEDFAANLDEFENVELYEALAEEALPVLDVQPDIVIVDPPRAGLHVRALDAILAQRPKCVAYVSCDPATLARDASRLVAGGYCLIEVVPFDLFPQTYHIESISMFEKV